MFWTGVLTGSVGSLIGMVVMVVLAAMIDIIFKCSNLTVVWSAMGSLLLIAIVMLIFNRPIDRQYKLFWLSISGGGLWMVLIFIMLCNTFFTDVSLMGDEGMQEGQNFFYRFVIGGLLPGLFFGILSKLLKVPHYEQTSVR